ncbi:SCO3374 family protein [Streptomyces sp. NPDC002845]
MTPTVPLPRRPPDRRPDRPFDTGDASHASAPNTPSDAVRDWYENGLGWATAPGTPVRLLTGLRFDVLDVPARAGLAGLRHLEPASPVFLHGERMRLLLAAGSADELPGLLQWLDWGTLALDLTVVGAGGHVEAPPPPARTGTRAPHRPSSSKRPGPRGAAVWLRPPEPGCEVEPSLPTLSALGSLGGSPDLVRLVDTVATHVHRLRLRHACAQPLAFS